jgi:hypothetical protein
MNWPHKRLTSGSQAWRSSAVPCSCAIAVIGRDNKNIRVKYGKFFIGVPKAIAESNFESALDSKSVDRHLHRSSNLNFPVLTRFHPEPGQAPRYRHTYSSPWR